MVLVYHFVLYPVKQMLFGLKIVELPICSGLSFDSEENVSGVDTQKETISGEESINTKSDPSVSGSMAAEATAHQPTAYKSVDIRL